MCGNLPGAALSTGRPSPLAAAGVAAALLLWGIWGLPEVSDLRLWLAHARGSPHLWTPAACAAICLASAVLLQVVRPDGRLHVQRLTQARGEAVFIRGPTGRTLLVAGGRLDGVQLATQVADNLAVWEHRLDSVLLLDPDAQAGLGPALARYPTEQLDAAVDARLDVGGGAALDIYPAEGQSTPAAAISFGRVWLPLTGRPPPPATPDGAQPGPRQEWLPAADLVSDGVDVWAADTAAQGAQLPFAAAALR